MKLQRILKLLRALLVGILSGVLAVETLARAARYASQAVQPALYIAFNIFATHVKERPIDRRINAVVI